MVVKCGSEDLIFHPVGIVCAFNLTRKIMNASNPFQIPSCFQAHLEQRRRKRFRKIVVTAIAVFVALLVGLLIEGCMSQHSQAADPSQAMRTDG
jgi:hypothetical protein